VIAQRLDLPLGTVKSRLRLAFDKIRKELGELE
ncbi:MAG: sigma factor-like helix-turn-helix DNA-binding protein, partial [Pseudomonadota bacterium]